MRIYTLALTAALLLCPLSIIASDDDIESLTKIKLELWPKAYREQNTELLDRILHPSFEMIDAKGVRSSKLAELEYVATHQWKAKNFRYEIQRLDIYDSKFAVVDGEGVTDSYRYMSSNYFIKENGRWQAIASHVSGFKPIQ
jgi:hypothetical protein